MLGPPGPGKSMLAQRLPGAAAATVRRRGARGQPRSRRSPASSTRRWRARPFRAPHHTASGVALVGGGSDPRPGEISLAHHGVLFLDELPEWDRRVLEVLREPLESGVIHISRAARQSTFPARIPVHRRDESLPMRLARPRERALPLHARSIARYSSRISGPLIDRIDLGDRGAGARRRSAGAWACARNDSPATVTSAQLRARSHGGERAPDARQGKPNARLGPREVETHCMPGAAGARSSRRRWRACRYPRAPITASSRWRERSPISRTVARSRCRTSRKPLPIGVSTGCEDRDRYAGVIAELRDPGPMNRSGSQWRMRQQQPSDTRRIDRAIDESRRSEADLAARALALRARLSAGGASPLSPTPYRLPGIAGAVPRRQRGTEIHDQSVPADARERRWRSSTT